MENKATVKNQKTTTRRPSEVAAPFELLTIDGEGTRILAYNAQVSETVFETQEDAEKYIESKPYEIILTTAARLAELIVKNLNNKNHEAES